MELTPCRCSFTSSPPSLHIVTLLIAGISGTGLQYGPLASRADMMVKCIQFVSSLVDQVIIAAKSDIIWPVANTGHSFLYLPTIKSDELELTAASSAIPSFYLTSSS